VLAAINAKKTTAAVRDSTTTKWNNNPTDVTNATKCVCSVGMFSGPFLIPPTRPRMPSHALQVRKQHIELQGFRQVKQLCWPNQTASLFCGVGRA